MKDLYSLSLASLARIMESLWNEFMMKSPIFGFVDKNLSRQTMSELETQITESSTKNETTWVNPFFAVKCIFRVPGSVCWLVYWSDGLSVRHYQLCGWKVTCSNRSIWFNLPWKIYALNRMEAKASVKWKLWSQGTELWLH